MYIRIIKDCFICIHNVLVYMNKMLSSYKYAVKCHNYIAKIWKIDAKVLIEGFIILWKHMRCSVDLQT